MWVLFFHPLNIYYLRCFCPQNKKWADLQKCWFNQPQIHVKNIYASLGQFPMCLTFKFNLYSLRNCKLLNCSLVQYLISVSYTYTIMLKNDKLHRQWLQNFFDNYLSQFWLCRCILLEFGLVNLNNLAFWYVSNYLY